MSRPPIPCNVVMKRLWAFIDGELDDISEREVREHLEMCQVCYPRYDFQRAYFRLMQRLAGRADDDGTIRSRIFEALLAESRQGADGEND